MAEAFNHFSEIGQQMHQAFSQLARTAAFNIQAHYQETCRVDTGFQKNSCYVITSDSSTYRNETGAKGQQTLPEIARPTSETEADVAVGASYAIINENGGVHHTGDGAMAKAVEAERAPFQSALSHLRVKG